MDTILTFLLAIAAVWGLFCFAHETHERAYHHPNSRTLQAMDSALTWLKSAVILWLVIFILLNGIAGSLRHVVRSYNIQTDTFYRAISTQSQHKKENVTP